MLLDRFISTRNPQRVVTVVATRPGYVLVADLGGARSWLPGQYRIGARLLAQGNTIIGPATLPAGIKRAEV